MPEATFLVTDTAGADNRVVADDDAGKNDRATADPDVAADRDPPAKLETCLAQLTLARMVGGIDLHRRADLGPLPISTSTTSSTTQLKFMNAPVAEPDVDAVVAEERRADFRAVTHVAKPLTQEAADARRGRETLWHGPGHCAVAASSAWISGSPGR